MEPTPEPEYQATATPTLVPQLEERPADSYFNMSFDQPSGLEALSTAATTGFQYIRPRSVGASPPSSNNLNFILNPAGPDRSVGMY